MKLEATDSFWVLYLVNILQPVSRQETESETRRLLDAAGRKTSQFNISGTLDTLVSARMVITREDGRYAVTLKGLQKLSRFNLGLARDKNRMFVLKNKLTQ